MYRVPYDASSSWFGAVWPARIINRQTVHHSWSLFERNKDARPEDAYGDGFRYDECLRTPGPVSALFVNFSIWLFVGALLISPVRPLVPRVIEPLISPRTDTVHTMDPKSAVTAIWRRP